MQHTIDGRKPSAAWLTVFKYRFNTLAGYN
jgi:hypothetical protein